MKQIYTFCFCILIVAVSENKSFAQCAAAVSGNTYQVWEQYDSGPGSLRQAIIDANTDNVGGHIDFIACCNPLYLSSPLPVVTCDSLLVMDNLVTVIIDAQGTLSDPGIVINAPHSCVGPFVSGINFNPTTFYVTSVNDNGPGTLRDVIVKSNFSPSHDNIYFNIPGQAPHAILPITALPNISKPITIDGTTQPANGYPGSAPKIELNGVNMISINAAGLSIDYDYEPVKHNANVYGLYVHSFFSGIWARKIGVFNFGALNKRNVVSGNRTGLSCSQDSLVHIRYNYIGTDTSGSFDNGNTYAAINIIAPTGLAAKYITNNVISGNDSAGFTIFGGDNFIIRSNLVGTDKTATYSIPNGATFAAISCGASNSIIGGINAGEGNLFSGNNGMSLQVSGSNDIVVGNKFGTNLAGTDTIHNNGGGVDFNGAVNFRMGGPTVAERNIIACCGGGVSAVNASGIIENNYIGTDITGTITYQNVGGGIFLFGNSLTVKDNLIARCATGVTINGTSHDTIINNTIHHSANYGIYNFSNYMLFTHNSIYDNGNMGIINDLGANQNIQKPVITSSTSSGVAGTSLPFATIEIFYSQSLNIYPQGKTYIITVTANASGNWNYTGSITDSSHVTATQTDGNGNTSEFADFVSPTDVNENILDAGVNLFPNPASDILNLSFQNFRDAEIIIYDKLGISVFSGIVRNQNMLTLNLASFSPGLYLLKLISEKDGRVVARRVVKL